MEVYEVRIYINKELACSKLCYHLNEAMVIANKNEDNGYICEIIKYEYKRTIRRDFWRDAKPDEDDEIPVGFHKISV